MFSIAELPGEEVRAPDGVDEVGLEEHAEMQPLGNDGTPGDFDKENTPVEPHGKETQSSRPVGASMKHPLKKRKKRKSVVLVKRKRYSSDSRLSRRSSTGLNSSVMSNDSEEIQAETPVQTPRKPRKPRLPTSSVVRSSPMIRSIEVDDDASDGEYVDDSELLEPPTPAPLKKATKKKRTDRGASKEMSKNPSNKKGATFPILIHRMTNIDALPAIQEEMDSNEEGSDRETKVSSLFTNRQDANAVDILAQICRETVSSAIEQLEEKEQDVPRAVRQRKRSALEAFGTDLDNRLFDVSAAVEERLTLEYRVRKAKREKADLQARWIEVRKQRERIALKCDRVRREHWENEQAREEKWRISEAARRTELELDRDQANEEESLEFLLRTTAEEVTNAHQGGGLLNRMQSFNEQLEKIASMLEGRS
jgi:hypothetical protein